MSTVTLPETPGVSPDSRNGDSLYEVVNGQRVELPPMSAYASWLSSRLQARLGPFTDAARLGTTVTEALLILDPDSDVRRRPDVAFVSAATWSLDRSIPRVGDWAVVPDLAVEVVSPNDTFLDVIAKMHEYFSYGVKEVWLVVPNEDAIYQYTAPETVKIWKPGQELTSDLLPGFRLALSEFFKNPVQTPQA